MTKKRRITVYLLAILFALSVSFMFIAAFNQSNAVFAASIFEYDGKVKTVAGDEDGGKSCGSLLTTAERRQISKAFRPIFFSRK